VHASLEWGDPADSANVKPGRHGDGGILPISGRRTSKTINVSGYTLTGSRAFNYTVTQPILTADITPASLTITGLTGDDKVYDRTTAATFSGTPVLNGVFAGDAGNVNVGGTARASFVSFDCGHEHRHERVGLHAHWHARHSTTR
jgi:hypothetical protein